ncbi:unnamed protein product [Blepharisma stoltei]|uniref:EF-hand domain-containing protein n=1 Tax=Blepharisma stoltei TaxID=1481888 RepID=A0AAU9J6H3_9CILI|nr:unnamed protein product [Blepharisma stoltei]
MGNSHSTPEGASEENWHVFNFEKRLGFSDYDASEVELAMLRNMKNSLITEFSYRNIESSLKLRYKETFRQLVFEKFQAEDGAIDGIKLATLGLLLSRGSEREKMTAIWNIFDEAGKGELDRKQFGVMITTLFLASLGPTIEVSVNQDFTSNALSKWVEKLDRKIPDSVKEILDFFLDQNPSLSISAFLTKLFEGPRGDLSNTFVIRRQLERDEFDEL